MDVMCWGMVKFFIASEMFVWMWVFSGWAIVVLGLGFGLARDWFGYVFSARAKTVFGLGFGSAGNWVGCDASWS